MHPRHDPIDLLPKTVPKQPLLHLIERFRVKGLPFRVLLRIEILEIPDFGVIAFHRVLRELPLGFVDVYQKRGQDIRKGVSPCYLTFPWGDPSRYFGGRPKKNVSTFARKLRAFGEMSICKD